MVSAAISSDITKPEPAQVGHTVHPPAPDLPAATVANANPEMDRFSYCRVCNEQTTKTTILKHMNRKKNIDQQCTQDL